MATPTIYLKTTGLVGELSEPWRFEATMEPQAQDRLDLAADLILLFQAPTVAMAEEIYTNALVDAIQLNGRLRKYAEWAARQEEVSANVQ